MHEVRVFANHEDDGPRWLAEDDLGFCGGSDSMDRLRADAAEWLESEGVAVGDARLVHMSDGRVESFVGATVSAGIDSQHAAAT